MTPEQVARRLIRRRDELGSPEFILAYARAELERDRLAFHTPAQRRLVRISDNVRELARAMDGLAGAAVRARAAMQRPAA